MEKLGKTQLQADALRLTVEALLAVGPEATSVDQVIRQLSIGKSQFYAMFRSKTELLVKAIEHLSVQELGLADIADLDALRTWFMAAQQSPPTLLRVLSTVGHANPDVKMLAANKIEELTEALTEVLERLDVAIAPSVLTSMLFGLTAVRQIDAHAAVIQLDQLLGAKTNLPQPVSLPPTKARPQPRLGPGFCP
jgi:AcrR family transcriptional regulator